MDADPLVSNGLGSPSCRAPERARLSESEQRNCGASGFVAAAAPTGDYGFDVHIDTGLSALGTGSLSGALQDLFLQPTWMALVWAVHGLVVTIEWGFSLELVSGAAKAELVSRLAWEQTGVTWPWLPLALAVAAVLVAYGGLVRRRVAETLGETLAMGAMIAGGLWLISNPAGSVGVLERWSGETSTGALALATGTPAAGARALGDGLGSIYTAAIEGPWCYLEFGDVAWCEEPARLDRRLRAAGLAAASEEVLQAGCADPNATCANTDEGTIRALRASVAMLRGARTNAAIFIALPANGPARNSINRPGSLLRTLCQSADANSCRGPTAAQARFRTTSGTESRLSGLALIAAGLLGMLLLLGFVAVRLVTAASQTLVYLLLAPALVLSPAFGERGRALFQGWAVRLLGAVVRKLVFAFLLGVLLSVSAILARLNGLGWWTQWLLLACFWWSTFMRRDRLMALVVPGARTHGGGLARPLAYGVGRSVTSLALRRLATRRDAAKLSARDSARPEAERGIAAEPERERERDGRARGPIDDDVRRLLAGDARTAAAAERRARIRSARSGSLDDQLERIEQARLGARANGERRRALELGVRQSRVQAQADEHRMALRRDAAAAERSRPAGLLDGSPSRGAISERERFLNYQAALGEMRQRPRAPLERDYAALAPLAGYDERQYEQLDAGARRAARLEVDRRLRDRRAKVTDAWPRQAGGSPRVARPPVAPLASPRRLYAPGEAPPLDERASRDPVMRDLWAVAAGKKRELGIGRD